MQKHVTTLQFNDEIRNTSFNGNLFTKVCTNKERIIINNIHHQNFKFVLKSCILFYIILNVKQTFDSTLCYDNVDDYDLFRL